jgi:hypothetical protein
MKLDSDRTCVFSFGFSPGVRLSFADVSEPSVRYIFKDLMKNTLHQAFEGGSERGFRNVGKTYSDAGGKPKRKYTRFRTRRNIEIKKAIELCIIITYINNSINIERNL